MVSKGRKGLPGLDQQQGSAAQDRGPTLASPPAHIEASSSVLGAALRADVTAAPKPSPTWRKAVILAQQSPCLQGDQSLPRRPLCRVQPRVLD